MTTMTRADAPLADHSCPRCGKDWVEMTRPPCPRCEMPFDTDADDRRLAGGSRVTEDEVWICGRCTDHESPLDLRDEPLPAQSDWPLHANTINRDLATTYGDREWLKLKARRLAQELKALD